MELIQMSNVKMQFNEQVALKSISLSVGEGIIFGLLGPSGAGKTTIIKILTGQLVPTEGSSTLFGVDSVQLKQSEFKRIGMVMDNCGLYARLSCYENLAVFCTIFGVPKAEISHIMGLVGLKGEEKKTVSKLSKGMTQRLALARAIIHRPRILFLDEPTSDLDPVTAKKVHDIIRNIQKSGTTVFLTTHNMNEAYKLCSAVAFLNKGEIVEMGSPSEICVKHYTKRKYEATLLGNIEKEYTDSKEDLGFLAQKLTKGEVLTLHSAEPSLEDVFLSIVQERSVD